MSDTDAEIPVGRELDAVVAVTILGWTDVKRVKSTARLEWIGYERVPKVPTEFKGRPPNASRHGGRRNIPALSTDFIAAMTVVEQMRQEGYVVKIESQMYDLKSRWYVSFCRLHPWGDGRAWNPSIPEAICRAALAAKAGQP